MLLFNCRNPYEVAETANGIGLVNVKRRLELLYPERYTGHPAGGGFLFSSFNIVYMKNMRCLIVDDEIGRDSNGFLGEPPNDLLSHISYL